MPITGIRARSMHHNLPIRTNLAAWYRYRIGMTNISGACSVWADQSGNNRPLLQATAALRPTINSDASLTFDGVSQYMATAAFTLVQPETVYMLVKQLTWTLNDSFIDGLSASTLRIAQSSPSPDIVVSAGTPVALNGNLALNVYGVVSAIFSGAASSLKVNGTTATTGDANTGGGGANGITLAATATPTNYSNIQVKEVIVYNVAHGAADRLTIMRYLARMGEGINF